MITMMMAGMSKGYWYISFRLCTEGYPSSQCPHDRDLTSFHVSRTLPVRSGTDRESGMISMVRRIFGVGAH